MLFETHLSSYLYLYSGYTNSTNLEAVVQNLAFKRVLLRTNHTCKRRTERQAILVEMYVVVLLDTPLFQVI